MRERTWAAVVAWIALVFSFSGASSFAGDSGAGAAVRPAGQDVYGGWTHLKGKKTGFFHTEQLAGRWWIITPEGNAFFSKGVDSVNLTGAKDEQALKKTDEAGDHWAAATAARLHSWGVNTAACWSDDRLGAHGIAWTPRPHLTDGRSTTIPDVFDPGWAENVRKRALEQCAPHKDDPWVLGYFTDNELPWANEDDADLVLKMFLERPADAPGRLKAEGFAKEHGHAKAREFRAQVAHAYFQVTFEAIRAADPNHLILGCRFEGHPPTDVVRAMKGYADVISLNNYSSKPPADLLAEMHKATGLPVMVTEFSVKAKDSGPLISHGSGPVVATQHDRALRYTKYVEDLADLNFCVGYHWFRYRDHPGNNQGLVKVNDEPWEKLAEAFRATNARLDERHAR